MVAWNSPPKKSPLSKWVEQNSGKDIIEGNYASDLPDIEVTKQDKADHAYYDKMGEYIASQNSGGDVPTGKRVQ